MAIFRSLVFSSRIATIVALLRRPPPVRPLLAVRRAAVEVSTRFASWAQRVENRGAGITARRGTSTPERCTPSTGRGIWRCSLIRKLRPSALTSQAIRLRSIRAPS